MPAVEGTRELGTGMGGGGTGGGVRFWASPSMIENVAGVALLADGFAWVTEAKNPPLDQIPNANSALRGVIFFLITAAIAIISP